jgi:energy-coupling factor transport system permease protein
MTNVFNYIDKDSPVHALTGASKCACMILWSVAAMMTFCTPYLILLTVFALLAFKLSKIKLKEVRVLLLFTLVFLFLNNVLIYLFSPEHGVELYSSRHEILHIAGRYNLTLEQGLYHLNVILKYTSTVPVIILFVATTNPSEFAASLNKLGVSYKVSYSVALALRYIPDTISEYQDISLAQQARGIEMSKKESLGKRLRAMSAILIPLIMSSMERIDTVANAMELRGFGKNRKRTWYMSRPFRAGDIAAIALGILMAAVSLAYTAYNGSRYWNPF